MGALVFESEGSSSSASSASSASSLALCDGCSISSDETEAGLCFQDADGSDGLPPPCDGFPPPCNGIPPPEEEGLMFGVEEDGLPPQPEGQGVQLDEVAAPLVKKRLASLRSLPADTLVTLQQQLPRPVGSTRGCSKEVVVIGQLLGVVAQSADKCCKQHPQASHRAAGRPPLSLPERAPCRRGRNWRALASRRPFALAASNCDQDGHR